MHLESVLYGPERQIAVINGQVLRVGDSVDGARLLRIEADKVTLQRGSTEVVLTLVTPLNKITVDRIQ